MSYADAGALLPKVCVHSFAAAVLKEPADSSPPVFLLTLRLTPGAMRYFVRSKGIH